MTKIFYLLFTFTLFFNISNAQFAVKADAPTEIYTAETGTQISHGIKESAITKDVSNVISIQPIRTIQHTVSRENAPTTSLAQCNSFAITGPATSGAFRAPNSRFRSGRLAYIVTAAEMTAANVANGQQITGIGWVNTIAPGITATGNFKLYLENSNDLVYSKSTDWATAITGMTTVHDGTLTIPNALDCNLTSFTGGTTFNYTGNSVYVAFEWTYCAGTLSTTQSSGCNNALVGGSNGSASLQSLTTCTPGTLLVTSAFRPVTKFFSDCHTNDIKVNALYSLGKLALGHSNNHVVSAYVSNNGIDPVNNIPVTLTVTGVNTLSNTQTIPSLAPGQGTIVIFPAYTPNSVGNNTVTVSVPADDVNSNNSKSVAQVVSLEQIGFKTAGDVSVQGAGFSGATGIIASRLNTASGGILKSVRVSFNTANGSTYRIAIYGDNNGVPSNTALYTDASNRTVTAAGETVLDLNPSVNIPAGNFYIAVQQLSTVNMQLSYTDESPLRSATFFANSVDLSSGWVDNSATLTFRFNVDALFYAYTITSVAGVGGTISPNGITGVDNNGSQSYTITPNSCQSIADVLADGISVGAVSSYTFSNVTGNHTIAASFTTSPPLAPPVVNGITNVCPYLGNSIPVTYTANSAGATNYSWVLPPNVNLISGGGTANLVLTFNSNFNLQANKQIRVSASSACGSSAQTIYYLLTQAPGTPAPFSAYSNQVCTVIGTNVGLTYSIPKVSGATSYLWQAQAGNTVITHPNGPGANDTTVTVTFTSGFTTSTISVQAVNDCGISNARAVMVYRNNPPVPGLISGPVNVCAYTAPSGMQATYTVSPGAGVASYNWLLPAGATGITGQGTNTVSFMYPAAFTSGSISVSAENGCGTGPARTLNVAALYPSTPGAIAVVNTVPCSDPGPDRAYTYSVPAMPANTTSIQWTVPPGAVIISGQGTTSITVYYPAGAVNGTVTAQAGNNCGSSGIRTVNVNLAPCPPEFASGRARSGVLTNDINGTFDVQIYPNPAIGEFKLNMTGSDRSDLVSIRILDGQGKVLKSMNLLAASQILVGKDLKPGIYVIEVRQGNNRKVMTGVKL